MPDVEIHQVDILEWRYICHTCICDIQWLCLSFQLHKSLQKEFVLQQTVVCVQNIKKRSFKSFFCDSLQTETLNDSPSVWRLQSNNTALQIETKLSILGYWQCPACMACLEFKRIWKQMWKKPSGWPTSQSSERCSHSLPVSWQTAICQSEVNPSYTQFLVLPGEGRNEATHGSWSG